MQSGHDVELIKYISYAIGQFAACPSLSGIDTGQSHVDKSKWPTYLSARSLSMLVFSAYHQAQIWPM